MVDETTPEDDEDWMKYANSGFGSTDYSLWDDVQDYEEEPEAFHEPEQLDSHTEEIPRAPSPAGLKHLVRMGICNSCLGRLGSLREGSVEERFCGLVVLKMDMLVLIWVLWGSKIHEK